MANSSGRHKSVTEGNAWFKGVDSVNYALGEAAQEFLIANIKLQTEKLWRVRYSMYLDRRAAVALVPISVSVIKTSTCCSCCELSGCVCVCVRVDTGDYQALLQQIKQFSFRRQTLLFATSHMCFIVSWHFCTTPFLIVSVLFNRWNSSRFPVGPCVQI